MADPEVAVDDLFGSESDDNDEQEPKTLQPENTQPESLEDDIPDVQGGGDAGLFGSDDDDDDAGRGTGHGPEQHRGTQQASSDSDDPDGRWQGRRREAAPLGPPIVVDAPLLPLPATKSVHLLRTTNIVGLQPRAFDATTYEHEDDSLEDESGRARVKLGANAVIRWRTRRLPDGREVRESNARFVRWEDGSMQLLLGQEVLDVAEQDIRANNQYLFVLRGLIQGQCPLGTKLALRPASLDSGLHKRLRDQVDKKHTKTNKVVSAGGLQNFELEQQRREKAEEEKIRSREQLSRKQEKAARPYGGGGYRSKATRLRDQGEEEQDWGDNAGDYDDGLTADQRARLSLARKRTLLDENAEAEAGRRLQAAKRGGGGRDDQGAAGGVSKKRRMAGSDDDEEEEEDVEYDDDEEEEEPEYESSGGEEDDDDDEGDAGEPSVKAKSQKPSKPSAAPVAETKAAKPRRRGVVLSDDESG